MTSVIKLNSKQHAYNSGLHKSKNHYSLKEKAAAKKQMLRHLIHPDYILFDWEFFSNQLEFE